MDLLNHALWFLPKGKNSGARAFRYRLHHKLGILNLLGRISGNIRNNQRIAQLQKMCILYKIPYKDPVKLTLHSSWFAGFFDADGTINPQLKFTSKPPVFTLWLLVYLSYALFNQRVKTEVN